MTLDILFARMESPRTVKGKLPEKWYKKILIKLKRYF